jgi:glycosyltransferase involved in cell wall biosynthesis
VIVPVYNGAAHVGAAVDSILAQETAEEIEIIVVDDGSTDDIVAALSRFGARIQLLRRDNGGVSAARNAGLAVARGDVIGFLDADDLWTEATLASLTPLLQSDPEADVARGRTRIIRLDAPDGPAQEMLQPVLVGSALYRRRVFDRVGLFDETLRLGEDVDFNARLLEAGCREVRSDAVVLVYRRHAGATVLSAGQISRGQFDAIRKRLARPRPD